MRRIHELESLSHRAMGHVMSPAVLGAVFGHASDEYPRECCGVVRWSGVVRCDNIQDELHAYDPAAHPRTSLRGFCLSAADMMRIYDSRATDDPVLAIYHSHPDGDIRFSALDAEGAMFDGRPGLPELFHLVVAVDMRGRGAAALYAWWDGGFRRMSVWPA